MVCWFISLFISIILYTVDFTGTSSEKEYLMINGNIQLENFFSDQLQDGESWETAYILEKTEFQIPEDYYGIRIENTDKFFIIKNCDLIGRKYNNDISRGIYLSNCKNIRIESIYLKYCRTGINIYNSDKIEIINNEFDGSTSYGIIVDDSSNITIFENSFLSVSTYDILIKSSTNCSLSKNSMLRSGLTIYSEGSMSSELLTIDSSNTVNGKNIYYYENETGVDIEFNKPIGQLIVNNCSDNIFGDTYIEDCRNGVIVYNSIMNEFTNITINDTIFSGFEVINSPNNTFSSNFLIENDYGFNIQHSNYTNLIKNDLVNNSKGIYYIYSNNLSLEENYIINEHHYYSTYEYCLKLEDSIFNNIEKNTFKFYFDEICLLYDSSNNTFTNNTFWGPEPIYISYYSKNNTFLNNNFINSSLGGSFFTKKFADNNTLNGKKMYYLEDQDGFQFSGITNISLLYLENCSNFEIKDLSFSKISYCPVVFVDCINYTILDLEISTSSDGIRNNYCYNGTISNCMITSSSSGIDINSCDNLTVHDNEIVKSSKGFNIRYSDDIKAYNNSITSWDYGIYAYNTHTLNFSINILNSSSTGIYLSQCNNSNVFNNQIPNSKYSMTIYDTYNYKILDNNFTYSESCVTIYYNYNKFIDESIAENNTCNYFGDDTYIPPDDYIDNFKTNFMILLLIMFGSIGIFGLIFSNIKNIDNEEDMLSTRNIEDIDNLDD